MTQTWGCSCSWTLSAVVNIVVVHEYCVLCWWCLMRMLVTRIDFCTIPICALIFIRSKVCLDRFLVFVVVVHFVCMVFTIFHFCSVLLATTALMCRYAFHFFFSSYFSFILFYFGILQPLWMVQLVSLSSEISSCTKVFVQENFVP